VTRTARAARTAVSQNGTGSGHRSTQSVRGFAGKVAGGKKRISTDVFVPRCARDLQMAIWRRNGPRSVMGQIEMRFFSGSMFSTHPVVIWFDP
jgi:hypothetical protein